MAAKAATKSEILSNIADATELSRKQVASVFDALSGQIKAAVCCHGSSVAGVGAAVGGIWACQGHLFRCPVMALRDSRVVMKRVAFADPLPPIPDA